MIPWHRLPRLKRLEDVTDDAASIAGGDQTGAFYRDHLRRLGLPVDDAHPANVYAVLATLDAVTTAVRIAHRNGVLDDLAVVDALGIVRTLELALSGLVPEEARR